MAATSVRLGIVGPISEEQHQEPVAAFISKVWKIVEKPEYNHLITWASSGKTFIVLDYPTFSKEVLPLYFKHSNFNSFVRQLNLYGFRKVSKPEHGSLAKSQADEPLEFWHTNFRRGHPELLHLVQRRGTTRALDKAKSKNTNRATVREGDEKSPQLSKVMSDIHQMKGRQESIASVLDALKQDNTHLRHEIGVLKDKHIRQQRVLNKIIQFLVHMVYKGKLPARRTRNSSGHLMLMDAESGPTPAKRRRTFSEELSSMPIAEFQSPDFPVTELTPSPTADLSYAFPMNPPSVQSVPSVSSSSSVPMYSASDQSASNSPSATGFALSPDAVESNVMPAPVSMAPTTSTVATTASTLSQSTIPLSMVPATDTDITAFQLPVISSDILAEFPIQATPSSLHSLPHPENRHCINGHINHQQEGIDAIPDMLSGHFSLDPSIISEFLLAEHHPVPDYDTIDTARLLEALSTDHDNISHETTLQQKNALVPVSLSADPTLSTTALPSPIKEQSAPILHQLLESDAN